MSEFTNRLKKLNSPERQRRWIFVPYDQLSDEFGPLYEEDPASLGIILIESTSQASRRPYHKQKLAYLWANMRHFAIEQAHRGVSIRYLSTDDSFSDTLRSVSSELSPIRLMLPAERELRVELQPLVEEGLLEPLPHKGWLTTGLQFISSQKGNPPPWRMDAFYRFVRRDLNVLMDEGKPKGGKYSFDAENRLPWSGEPEAPDPPKFTPDKITREVGKEIEKRFPSHPGQLDLTSLPATKSDSEHLWSWAKDQCLENFGPYEDAMSSQSTSLFHTRISSLLNISRLNPRRVLADVLDQPVPLGSKEGFVRQILGWREFMCHVHELTEGFRTVPGLNKETWTFKGSNASPSFLGANHRLFPVYWKGRSGLFCLDQVVSEVWKEGYSHHITRLMVLSNLATLLDVNPRELTDWFWCAYTDAYDWVVEPNVLGMGTFALGDLFTTKPYVSGSAYIHKMSDYCASCQFDPGSTCPIASLYWAFLKRHEKRLGNNPRMRIVMASLRKRSREKKERDHEVFQGVCRTLAEGRALKADQEP